MTMRSTSGRGRRGLGENGAGKTTLLKIIMDTLEPWKGIRTSYRNLKVGYFTQPFVDQVFYQLNRNNCFMPDPHALTCCSST